MMGANPDFASHYIRDAIARRLLATFGFLSPMYSTFVSTIRSLSIPAAVKMSIITFTRCLASSLFVFAAFAPVNSLAAKAVSSTLQRRVSDAGGELLEVVLDLR